MSRLIDADAMRKEWLENGENEFVYDTNAVLESIDEQPIIDPVHAAGGCYCYECENADPYMCVGTPTDDVNASLFRCYKYDGIYRMRYDFCSRGERREENEPGTTEQ